ncbi:hypothetical protein [Microscilla marina]|uniref:Uncharacterized protein n=1 Tax=Microscilla marina ATCC 23134 TaxID=313606 RepID=A1ZDJ8_MICM2|nr:hypothetical protein [Microscilla marina]EAY31737.1 hypothetical protein M23134_05243 [Microscilla marina ATCC 23134]
MMKKLSYSLIILFAMMLTSISAQAQFKHLKIEGKTIEATLSKGVKVIFETDKIDLEAYTRVKSIQIERKGEPTQTFRKLRVRVIYTNDHLSGNKPLSYDLKTKREFLNTGLYICFLANTKKHPKLKGRLKIANGKLTSTVITMYAHCQSSMKKIYYRLDNEQFFISHVKQYPRSNTNPNKPRLKRPIELIKKKNE